MAKKFTQLPGEIRSKMANSNYSKAEKVCPQKMPLAQLMKEVSVELSTDKEDA